MTALQPDYFDRPLAEVDPEVAEAIGHELERQQRTLEMIASENFVPQAVLECQGSVLTNKYAEGYPGKRYYGGCEYVDVIEQLAIDRAKALFGAEHANVQPHAGAQANTAVYHALLQPGDTIMGLALPHGGHLSHGMKINVSGPALRHRARTRSRREDHRIDMDEVERLAKEHRPKLLLAGWSAYPRVLDFPRFREIADEVGALLMVDMAHFAGLVAAGMHPSPVPYADVVTTTVHKTLGGPRCGLILCREEYAKKINSAVFPGQQGGPLEHVIAAKAVAFKIAASDAVQASARSAPSPGAKALAEELLTAGHGVNVLTGGTDVHLVLVDLRDSELDGQQAEDRLHDDRHHGQPQRGAVRPAPADGHQRPARRHAGAGDPRPAGRRLPRGRQDHRPRAAAGLRGRRARELAERVTAIADRYPLYAHLGTPARPVLEVYAHGGGRERTGRPRARRARAADAARPRRGDPRLGAAPPGDARPRRRAARARAWRPGARSTSRRARAGSRAASPSPAAFPLAPDAPARPGDRHAHGRARARARDAERLSPPRARLLVRAR